MVEQVFSLSQGDERTVERVVFDENIHYLHMVFNQDQGLPQHYSNSNVYMTVLRGTLSIGLNDQEVHEYEGNFAQDPGDKDECRKHRGTGFYCGEGPAPEN